MYHQDGYLEGVLVDNLPFVRVDWRHIFVIKARSQWYGYDHLFTTSSVTWERDSPFTRWKVMLPDEINFVLKELRISRMFHWRILSFKLLSRTLAPMRFAPVLESKTRWIGDIRAKWCPMEKVTVSFYFWRATFRLLPGIPGYPDTVHSASSRSLVHASCW